MSVAKLKDAAQWLGRRAFTGFLYILAIIGASNWDADPNSWFRITLRLGASAAFLSWAVRQTVTHWHEDQEAT